MKINQDDLNKYPELMAFIAANRHDQEHAYNLLKPSYPVHCSDSDGKNRSSFSGNFGLTPLIIISALGHLDHLDIILSHNPSRKYSNSYCPSFLASTNFSAPLFGRTKESTPNEKVSYCITSENQENGIPVDDGFFALRAAATSGHLDILQRLLIIPKFQQQISRLNNIILRKAVQAGHAHIVSFLLAQEEVVARLQEGNCYVLDAAVKGASLEILEKLLTITPSIFDKDSKKGDWNPTNALPSSKYIATAIKEGSEEIACRLLQIPEVNAIAADNDNHILRLSLCNKKFNLANQLLDFPSVQTNLAARNGRVLHVAARTGNLEIFNRLLAYPEVLANADSDNNKAITIAAANGHIDVVIRLLAVPQVASTVDLYQFKVLRSAYKGTGEALGPHNEIIELLKPYHPSLSQIERSCGKNFFLKGNFDFYDAFGIDFEDQLEDHDYGFIPEDDGIVTAHVERRDPDVYITYA